MRTDSAIVAVLAGGRGTRIGGAKATVELAGRPLISHALAAARDSGLETIVVAKAGTPLPGLAEQIVLEPGEPTHPLCGVLAALDFAAERHPSADVVLSACDMPFLTGALLRWIGGLEGAAMAQVGGRPQPLLARCTWADRPALADALARERPLSAALEALEPRILDERELGRFGSPPRLCFNVNDAQDAARAEAWLS
ncbi:MAG TPA: molybdenum cofactor guanylyltransferase [Solirubrobacteraceae bacterium]|nr:molybdenum cofactor guanylyltransferase [Solirubrobacteraceae bacterium]